MERAKDSSSSLSGPSSADEELAPPSTVGASRSAARVLQDRLISEMQSQPPNAKEKVPLSPELLAMAYPAPTSQDKVADTPSDSQTFNYTSKFKGQAFVASDASHNDIDPEDIHQGQLGDCWLLAAMAAIARENPDAIRRLIKDNGDNTYDVTLYLKDDGTPAKTPHVIRVDSKFPVNQDGTIGNAKPGNSHSEKGTKELPIELWPMLIEKAYAVYRGSYDALEGDNLEVSFNAMFPTDSTRSKTKDFTAPQLTQSFSRALAERRPITVGSRKNTEPADMMAANEAGIADRHAYAVKSVDAQAGTISLQNPWGHGDVDNLAMAKFVMFFLDFAIGPAP